ncbi:peptidase G1 [Butyriboletus roseoflavus]|nr:peptidase G1 [Butyriboletus roseoflavus]
MIMTRNSGMVIIRNRTRGWATTFEVNSQREICGSEAEWLVIDYRLPNGLYIPLAKFGSVTFGGAFATGLGGVMVSPLGAALLDIVQGGAPLTATSVDPNNGLLTVRYAGM